MRFIADSYSVTWRPDNEARQSETTSQQIRFNKEQQRFVFYKQVDKIKKIYFFKPQIWDKTPHQIDL